MSSPPASTVRPRLSPPPPGLPREALLRAVPRRVVYADDQPPHAYVAFVGDAVPPPGNAISGMPIPDVDRAKSVVVINRSMGQGYAGIDNEFYTAPKTGMFFTDAKKGLSELKSAVGEFVS
ncbi:NAD(P)(+) transhydrogenase (Re/Si-specific) subunit beta [Streptomyces sp. ActVer]|uniref:NAD(P)(+) transhydrogenase (Re/Si-specific) subunit beta n=1 Tax=Streptomyces sp. ActVer TaxID=3014558 RepID=UPI0022B2EFDC|nr:NAD(P)(+) transhydrogenase (Re/Si-specific) subunit beta [Streptomyces sp. ActVer]MCZ4513622.1 NAD(P)(+) transhydrogenase (Re/Si-specific) subunit beta [Streptomyces sp. ActVer]